MADNDDPFQPSDLTHRPRPGAGRRGMPDPPTHRGPAVRPAEVEAIPDAARASLGLGLNPLVQAAIPLLLLTGQLRSTPAAMDVAGLRRHVLEEIRRFEDQARAAGIRNEIVLAARYALCAALDEAVLSTPWGGQSEWAQHPVLVALHREAWGGEKFFEMLTRISADPARHLDLLELQNLILALGFTGKYQMIDRGQEQLQDLQHELFRTIRGLRGACGSRPLAEMAGSRGPAQSADSLCAVVGRRRRRRGDPDRRVSLLPVGAVGSGGPAPGQAGPRRHRGLRSTAAGRAGAPGRR